MNIFEHVFDITDLLMYISIIGGIYCVVYGLYITFKERKNKPEYKVNIMTMDDDIVKEIDRICGYGGDERDNSDSDDYDYDYDYYHISLDEHPKNEEGVFWDLVNKYNKYGTLYIGVDFDNTLMPYGMEDLTDGNLIKAPFGFFDILNVLRDCKYYGLKLCLWSLPTSDENLEWKVRWCKEHDIEMDFVNCSPLMREYSDKYGKPHFNLLLDDVAGLESSYSILVNLCEYIKKKGVNGKD